MKIFFVLTVPVLLFCGCGIFQKEPYKNVYFYDFSSSVPKLDTQDVSVTISQVSADRPYYDRMVFRVSGNQVEIDEYNRWAGNPSDMVRNYLSTAFGEALAGNSTKRYSVSAKILQIEANLKTSMVRSAMQITVQDMVNDNIVMNKIYQQEMPVEKITGDSFAKTVETEMGIIAAEIARDVQAASIKK